MRELDEVRLSISSEQRQKSDQKECQYAPGGINETKYTIYMENGKEIGELIDYTTGKTCIVCGNNAGGVFKMVDSNRKFIACSIDHARILELKVLGVRNE